jgi:hypothetical protein
VNDGFLLSFGPHLLDPVRRILRRDCDPLALTSRPFNLLALLRVLRVFVAT